MKAPNLMTQAQLVHWTIKTANSMRRSALAERGYRLADLQSRYYDLTAELKVRGLWVSYCENSGLSVEHDANDCVA